MPRFITLILLLTALNCLAKDEYERQIAVINKFELNNSSLVNEKRNARYRARTKLEL